MGPGRLGGTCRSLYGALGGCSSERCLPIMLGGLLGGCSRLGLDMAILLCHNLLVREL